MKQCLKIFFIAGFIAFSAQAQAADYKYANNDAEYSVTLPEAPTVTTIWADSGKVPYLENPPKEGSLGETAVFRRTDPETKQFFDTQITFLKAGHDFLDGLTEDKMKTALKADFKDSQLTDEKFSFSAGKGGLKWAILAGFSMDPEKHPVYNEEHYLTGQQSIMIVKVRYSVENKTFQGYYKTLTDSITYNAP